MFEKEFGILEIEKTRDENAIRSAYRQRLMVTNPEDKPEEFKVLRTAYEAALKYAREGEPEQQGEAVIYTQGLSESPVAKWMDRVNDVCSTVELRYSTEEWKKLLADDACNDFDTSGEAALALLRYLMDHYYLTAEIFRMIDDKFEIRREEAEWKEKLPAGFLNYIFDKIKDEKGDTDFSFEWLKGEKGKDFDGYVRSLEELNNRLWENNLERSEQILRELDATGIWHPFRELGEMRLMFLKAPGHRLFSMDREKVLSKLRKLLADYPSSRRIPLEAGEFLWWCEEYEESAQVYYELEKRDSHFMIDKYLAKYEYRKGDLKAALLRLDRIAEAGEEEVKTLLCEVDEKFCSEFEKSDGQNPENLQLYLYCCLRLQRLEKIKETIQSNPMFTELDEKDFLLYRYYLENGDYGRARIFLRAWTDKMRKEEETGKNPEGKNSYGIALLLMARICCEGSGLDGHEKEGWLSEALEAVQKARLFFKERDPRNLLAAEYQELKILIDMKRFQEAYDLSGKVLEVNPSLYQIISIRQKCCMKLHNAQEVIDLYRRGVDAVRDQNVPEEGKEDVIGLYENAAEIFMIFNHFADAESVLSEAKEKGYSSAKLTLISVGIDRKQALESKNREEQLQAVERICEKIAEMEKQKASDEILSEAYHNKGLVENELKSEGDAAVKTLETAVRYNNKNTQALFYLGRLLMQRGRYDEAEKCFREVVSIDGYNAAPFCNLIDCALRLQKVDDAVELTKTLEQNEENKENYLDMFCDVYYSKLKQTELREDAEVLLTYVKQEIAYLEERKENVIRYMSYRIEAELVLGDYEAAQRSIEKMLQVYPKSAYFLYQKSRMYYYLGEWGNAVQFAKEAFSYASEQQYEAYLLQICVCTLHLKDLDQILYWFDRYFKEAKGSKKRGYQILCEFLRNMDEPELEMKYTIQRSNANCYEKNEEAESDFCGCAIRKYRGSRFKMYANLRQREKMIRKAPLSDIEREVALDYLYYFGNAKKAEQHLINWTEIEDLNAKELYPFETALLAMSYRDRKANADVVLVCGLLVGKLRKLFNTMDEMAAIQAYVSLQADYGKKRKMMLQFALLFAAAGETEKARELERRAIEYLPCSHCACNLCVDLEFLHGYLFETEGRYEEALKCYRRISEEFPACDMAIWRVRHIKKNRS